MPVRPAPGAAAPYNRHSPNSFSLLANTTSTPKHTDPATKKKDKQNEEVIKDKPSGKVVKTQKK